MPASVGVALDALGDPRRRSLLERLPAGPAPVGVLTEQLPISRPAVSQGSRVLEDAGLVVEITGGAESRYRGNQAVSSRNAGYLDQFWSGALDNFAAFARAEVGVATTVDERYVTER